MGCAGSIPTRACRPSRSEFSVVFSETRVGLLLWCLGKASILITIRIMTSEYPKKEASLFLVEIQVKV